MFYRFLETKYGLRLRIFQSNMTCSIILSKVFGLQHYAVERKIVEILHERSKMGVYDEAYEVPAFAILVNSYMAEVDQTVMKNKSQIEKNLKTLAKIEKTPT